MKREDALEELKKPAYDPETIENDINYIATKLEISKEELMSYFNIEKKFYWDYPNQQSMFRIGAKILHLFGVEKSVKR
jgi:hypothetical protein